MKVVVLGIGESCTSAGTCGVDHPLVGVRGDPGAVPGGEGWKSTTSGNRTLKCPHKRGN